MQSILNKCIFVFLAFAGYACAQGGISVESAVDRSTVLIGDVIVYTISIQHDPDVKVRKPGFAENLDMFEVRDFAELESEKIDGKIIEKLQYELSTFFVGEYDIPELEIKYVVEPDSAYQSIKTEPIRITVKSLNPDEAGDIRDIKPPITPPRAYKTLIFFGLGALLIAALIVFAVYYVRKRKSGRSLLPKRTPPPRPAHEIALEALETLEAKNLPADGKIKQFYTELSDIVRQYMDDRYYIDAMEMTTLQLLSVMQEERLPERDIVLMESLLQSCDLVKFAKYQPAEAEHPKALQSARRFIDQTKMVLEPPVEEDAGRESDEPEEDVPQIEELKTEEEN